MRRDQGASPRKTIANELGTLPRNAEGVQAVGHAQRGREDVGKTRGNRAGQLRSRMGSDYCWVFHKSVALTATSHDASTLDASCAETKTALLDVAGKSISTNKQSLLFGESEAETWDRASRSAEQSGAHDAAGVGSSKFAETKAVTLRVPG